MFFGLIMLIGLFYFLTIISFSFWSREIDYAGYLSVFFFGLNVKFLHIVSYRISYRSSPARSWLTERLSFLIAMSAYMLKLSKLQLLINCFLTRAIAYVTRPYLLLLFTANPTIKANQQILTLLVCMEASTYRRDFEEISMESQKSNDLLLNFTANNYNYSL